MTEITTRQREGKYLTFALDNEEYGIGILKIREIIGLLPITPIPQVPEQVKGVVNLRGKVIPVLDLRLRFGLAPIEYTERTCIVVVEIKSGSGRVPVGVIVDSVSEVLQVRPEEVEDTPNFGAALDTGYILGLAKMNGGVKILLDIDCVLGSEGAALLEKAA
ncbi:MAG: chemotaxis protein CheW [Thermodesulfobacteriota bacterium]